MALAEVAVGGEAGAAPGHFPIEGGTTGVVRLSPGPHPGILRKMALTPSQVSFAAAQRHQSEISFLHIMTMLSFFDR